MERLAATVKSYENHEDGFQAVVTIEVSRWFPKVQLDHGVSGGFAGNLDNVGRGNHEVVLSGPGKCPFDVGNCSAPKRCRAKIKTRYFTISLGKK
jgi:hypothetical protein